MAVHVQYYLILYDVNLVSDVSLTNRKHKRTAIWTYFMIHDLSHTKSWQEIELSENTTMASSKRGQAQPVWVHTALLALLALKIPHIKIHESGTAKGVCRDHMWKHFRSARTALWDRSTSFPLGFSLVKMQIKAPWIHFLYDPICWYCSAGEPTSHSLLKILFKYHPNQNSLWQQTAWIELSEILHEDPAC